MHVYMHAYMHISYLFSFRPLMYPDTDVVLICFSISNPDSLHNVVDIWSPEIHYHCDGAPIILVGTKSDTRTDPDVRAREAPFVDFEMGKNVAKLIGAVEYLECSALRNEGVRTVFETAARVVLRAQSIRGRFQFLRQSKRIRRVFSCFFASSDSNLDSSALVSRTSLY